MKDKALPSIPTVSEADWEKTPSSVKTLVLSLVTRVEELENQFEELRAENTQLRAENTQLRAENAQLRAENELLKEKLQRNSQNSSQPPSEDKAKGFKPKKPRSGRSRGGQLGHPGKGPKLYPPEACARIDHYYPSHCHHCGEALSGEDPSPYRVQKVDVPQIKPVVVEHRFHQLACECCGALTRGWDEGVINTPRYGERLTGLVGWLSSVGHQSHGQVKDLLCEVFDIEISTGGINRLRMELSESLSAIVESAGEYIQQQAQVNMDETGFRQGNGDGKNPQKSKGWLWVVVTPLVSYFSVFLSRSQGVAKEMLGDAFGGIVGSDRCGAYSWLGNAQRQVCWAHLKRDFTKIAERSGRSTKLGKALLKQQKRLFERWYQVRDGTLPRGDFIEQVKPIRCELRRLLNEGADYEIEKGDKTSFAKTVRTCRKLLTVEPAFWTFVEHDGVEPTNNAAERALRPAVLWRKQSFGANSQEGSQFVARMMTTVTSLKAQQRSIFDFLSDAVKASRHGSPVPSLIPEGD